MSPSSCPRRSVRPVVVALVLGTLLVLAPVAGVADVPRATAAPSVSVPPEWEVRPSGHGTTVTWHSPARLPLGGAAPEFRAGGRLLGHPTPSADLHSLSLTLPTTRAPAPASLQVWLSGRRLDGSTPRSSVRVTPYLGPARGQTTLPVDPGEPGPWATTASRYTLDPVRVPDLPLPVDVAGHVVAPAGARGPRPLVLLLHGRHPSCYLPGTDQVRIEWPCVAGWKPVPNHLGYRYLQRLLASQGYVTVSIAANAIDGQETFTAPDFGAAARAALVHRHLRAWARWAADPGNPWSGRVDLDAVTLVGHSRGGEGVNRAAIGGRSSAAYTVAGLVLLAPTDFGRQAAPGVPTVTLLGYCDGDVTDLAGQGYADVGRGFAGDAAVRSSVLVMGANHNYFNTEWTPGLSTAFAEDDWRDRGDPICGDRSAVRLSAAEQRAVAATYVAGAVRLVARRDGRVLPMFDGSSVRVPSAGESDVRSTAVGARRRLVVVGPDAAVATSGPVRARVCRGQSSGPPGVCGAGVTAERTPHWPLGNQAPYRPGPPALEVAWTGTGGTAELLLERPLDLSGSTSVDARVIVDPADPVVRLALRLEDADGSAVVLQPRGGGRLDAFPGTEPLGKFLAQTLRTPLAGVSGVDLTRITRVGLASRTERGRVWVLDVAGRRAGLAPASRPSVPVVRLLDVEEAEGSAADPQRVELTMRIRGELTRPARVAVRALEPVEGRLLRRTSVLLSPGQRTATFTVPYRRDDRDDFPDTSSFDGFVFATSGAVTTGDYAARATIRDDDPSPRVVIRRVHRTVTEGDDLRWRVALSEPVDYFAGFSWRVVSAEGDARQLRSDDVPAAWLRDFGVNPPRPPVPLWRLEDLGGFVGLDPGQRRASVAIPTLADGRVEPREVLALRFEGEQLQRRPVVRLAGVRDGSLSEP